MLSYLFSKPIPAKESISESAPVDNDLVNKETPEPSPRLDTSTETNTSK